MECEKGSHKYFGSGNGSCECCVVLCCVNAAIFPMVLFL